MFNGSRKMPDRMFGMVINFVLLYVIRYLKIRLSRFTLSSLYINVPRKKPVLPSAAKTTSYTGLKMCMSIVLALRSDQKAFSQPSCWCNFVYQRTQTSFILFSHNYQLHRSESLHVYSFNTEG